MILIDLHHQVEAQSQKYDPQINLKQWDCWFLVCRRWWVCVLAVSPLSHTLLLETCIGACAPPWLAFLGQTEIKHPGFSRSECCLRKLCSLGASTRRTQAGGSERGRLVETGEVNTYPAAALWTSKAKAAVSEPRHKAGRRLQHGRWRGRCRLH